ncbi:MAG: alpha/beta hydrolase [Phaeodactylibacter sp.]|uniref:alpha/beta fold hydrolase n=1 Tax=Phaeodactylibacter sp. TaxID=1940289 RepID=UPI0032EC574F
MAKRSFLLCLSLLPCLILFAQTKTGFAPAGGVDIYYELYGGGAPVVIINGGPGLNSNGFQDLALSLSERYQVILYDQRGTGQSNMKEVSPENITMDLMAADLEALRKHLGYQEWTVLGHSFGGILGNYYTAKYPAAVRAMIASASGGIDLGLLTNYDITRQMTEVQRDSFMYWTAQLSSGDTSERVREKRLAFMATAYLYDDRYAPKVAERLGQSNRQINQLIWQNLQRIQYDVREAATAFQKPVLIIQGEQDVILPQTGKAARDAFPNSTWVLMPECGHYGWIDQPALYFKSIHAFMDALPAADEKAIREVLNNYVHSIYKVDSSLVYAVTDTTLQKSGHYYSDKSGAWSYSDMTFQQLVYTAARYNLKGHIPNNAPVQVEIFDIGSQTASAKVSAIWGFDYVLLSQDARGKWRMDKVLWQSYSTETRRALQEQMKR